jgi:signal transduction histidine kinase
MLKNQASGTIVLAFLLFILWQLIDSTFLNSVPIETRHFLFIIVASTFAIIVSWMATHEINRQYKRLRRLEELKDDLTGMLVHDLRTPLTSMIGSLATMQQSPGENLSPGMSEMVDISKQGAEHLLSMVNDILDISRMESGSIALELHELKVKSLVDSAAQHMRHLAFEKNIDLQVEDVDGELRIECDEDKIHRVLINLLGNAVKYTPSNGTVGLSVVEDEKTVTFKVSDTGPGVPAEFRDKIFDKYAQVDSRQSAHVRSTGLGLTFCKLAVDAHHGRVWLESIPGDGSIFQFSIPKHQTQH